MLRIRKTPVVTNQKASSPSRHNNSFTSDRDDSPFVNEFESPLLRTLCPYGEIITISLFSRLSGHHWLLPRDFYFFLEHNHVIYQNKCLDLRITMGQVFGLNLRITVVQAWRWLCLSIF